MTLPLGTDELDVGISPAAIKAAGYQYAMMYSRVLTAGIAKSFLDEGLGVATIFEYSANRALGGAAAGTADGRLYISQLRTIGQPSGTFAPVNLTDFAALPTDIPALEAYWRAFTLEAGAYQLCGYATSYAITALWNSGLHTLYWQNAMNDNGVLGSIVNPHAILVQRIAHTLTPVRGVPASDYDEDAQLGSGINWWKAGIPNPPWHPVFPLPTGYFFGPASGGTNSISGLYPPYGGANGSPYLREWQTKMLQRGWRGIGTPDGKYGPKTAAVTEQFQGEKHLVVDGKIGAATWAAAWTAPTT